MLALFRAQPRAFHMIFMLEIWERFGFYTVQGILTLYFIRFLGFSDTVAYYTFGAFSALVYGLVSFGGYLGDNVLGTKRTIVLGLITLALGYLSLAITDKEHVFLALGLVCVGNGLFKANPSSLLAKCYEENDPRLYGGFTLYYMAINLGSTVALFVGPALSSTYGYFYAYFISFIGLVLGLANYWFQRRHVLSINTAADRKEVKFWQWLLVIAGIVIVTIISAYLLQHVMLAKNLVWVISAVVVTIYFFYMRKENKASFMRMVVAFILMLEAIVFFTLYQQMPTSLNLFAVHNVTPTLLGISIDPQSFQALNPIWIITLSPVLAMLYGRLHQQGISFPVPYKFATGMLCCGVSFGLLFFARYFHDTSGVVSSWWLIASYFFQSTGELLVSALGVAMVAELVPNSIAGFVMGMWFLTSAIAGFIGATVASYTSLPENLTPGIESLMIYTKVFAWIGLVTLAIGLLMLITSPQLSRYIKRTAAIDI
ncbi:oligopeptide:H+ symporter [Legionella jamestowniensis]|uniref:POT family transporter peptide transport protein n=1 Tax=Legionella jamestowniensis TaxID=455 RepID=A0A0W0UIL1_9GAMM|nr:oligopeptide:H+ symporter [Legionella jamestowniensis]KTD07501.1 POT family transporter peptide transport protein [Legionella jamestowniensis]OCH97726.1 peptide ABC transporter permease [Legionella jamestowniensis]SFM00957.1 proton-dependent oligopeptide transporter, POT family [Legionella jamestowniensis DSM 19215]